MMTYDTWSEDFQELSGTGIISAREVAGGFYYISLKKITVSVIVPDLNRLNIDVEIILKHMLYFLNSCGVIFCLCSSHPPIYFVNTIQCGAPKHLEFPYGVLLFLFSVLF